MWRNEQGPNSAAWPALDGMWPAGGPVSAPQPSHSPRHKLTLLNPMWPHGIHHSSVNAQNSLSRPNWPSPGPVHQPETHTHGQANSVNRNSPAMFQHSSSSSRSIIQGAPGSASSAPYHPQQSSRSSYHIENDYDRYRKREPLNDHRSASHTHQSTNSSSSVPSQPLTLRRPYAPRVEAISPTLPDDLPSCPSKKDLSSSMRTSKDELLQNINRIEREMGSITSQLNKLRKKQQDLEAATTKAANDKENDSDAATEPKQLSIAQIIYSDNREKATLSVTSLTGNPKLGTPNCLPLYNQPSDSPMYHENRIKFESVMKKRLVMFFKRQALERINREKSLTDTYDRLMHAWMDKNEKKENQVAKKSKETKYRDFFEKQFPELRRQREDKERLSRCSTRTTGIRSDAEMEEVLDGLQEQELEDKRMRSYAVIPPILLHPRDKRHRFINRNGLTEDPLAEHKERQMLNIWTDAEKVLFRDKYLLHPKNFSIIAPYLDKKSVPDCVQFYYLSKKSVGYKQLLRKLNSRKRTRAVAKQQAQQAIILQQQAQDAAEAARQAQIRAQQAAAEKNSSDRGPPTENLPMDNKLAPSDQPMSLVNQSVAGEREHSKRPISPDQNNSNLVPSEGSQPVVGSSKSRKQTHHDDLSDTDDQADANGGAVHSCCLCSTVVENVSKSRALTRVNCLLYGIKEEDVKNGMRICLDCRYRHVRHECPVPSCKTPKRKVKRLKRLPQQWLDLGPESRKMYAADLNIPLDVKKMCMRCVMRVSRRIGAVSPSPSRLGSHVEDRKWTDEEIEHFKNAIRHHGKNWTSVSLMLNGVKSPRQCKSFYFAYKYKLNLKECVEAGGRSFETDSDDYFDAESEGDSEETSSADESHLDASSAHISAASNMRHSSSTVGRSTSVSTSTGRLPQEALHGSRASIKSDCDSSATMSADEGQPILDNDRRITSPAVSLQPRGSSIMPIGIHGYPERSRIPNLPFNNRPAEGLIAAVAEHHPKISEFYQAANAASYPGQPHPGKEGPACVRDLIHQAIELSLQNPAKRTSGIPASGNPSGTSSSREVPDISQLFPPDQRRLANDQNRLFQANLMKPEGLAMIASSYSQIPQFTRPPSNEAIGLDLTKKERRNTDSPRNLLKEVKREKTFDGQGWSEQRVTAPPPAHSNQTRSSNSTPDSYFGHGHRSPHSPFVQERPREVGLLQPVVSAVPRPPVPPRSLQQPLHVVPPPPPLITTSKQSMPPALVPSQISPKMGYPMKESRPSNHSIGSITQGTPVMMPQMHHPYPNQRYEGLLRPMTPNMTKEGSITMGTPVVHDVKRKSDSLPRDIRPDFTNRHTLPMGDALNVEAYYRRMNEVHNQPQPKAAEVNQLLIDFNTSKQMVNRRGTDPRDDPTLVRHHQSQNRQPDRKPETRIPLDPRAQQVFPIYQRNSPSPHLIPTSGYSLNDARFMRPPHEAMQQRGSPSSFDWQGKTSPSMSRQNVIQNWYPGSKHQQPQQQASVIQTTGSSRTQEYRRREVSPAPPSAPPRMAPPASFMGHDALTTLVNAAVAQPAIPIHKDDKKRDHRPPSRDRAEGFEKSFVDSRTQELIRHEERSRAEKDRLERERILAASRYYGTGGPVPSEMDRRLELEHLAETDRHRLAIMTQRSLESEQRAVHNAHHHSLQTVRRGPDLDTEASLLLSQSFQKDSPKSNGASRSSFTAANLIDAIITHQISQSAEGGLSKLPNLPTISASSITYPGPSQHIDAVFEHYRRDRDKEEVVTIRDSPLPSSSEHSAHLASSDPNKGFTLGEQINSIISKNYSGDKIGIKSHPQMQMGIAPGMNHQIIPPHMARSFESNLLKMAPSNQPQHKTPASSLSANQSDQSSSWKLRKALQQNKELSERQIIQHTPAEKEAQPAGSSSHSSQQRSHIQIPDRILEPISPPLPTERSSSSNPQRAPSDVGNDWRRSSENSLSTYQASQPQNQTSSGGSRAGKPNEQISPFDYVKSRLVEVMRTSTESPESLSSHRKEDESSEKSNIDPSNSEDNSRKRPSRPNSNLSTSSQHLSLPSAPATVDDPISSSENARNARSRPPSVTREPTFGRELDEPESKRARISPQVCPISPGISKVDEARESTHSNSTPNPSSENNSRGTGSASQVTEEHDVTSSRGPTPPREKEAEPEVPNDEESSSPKGELMIADSPCSPPEMVIDEGKVCGSGSGRATPVADQSQSVSSTVEKDNVQSSMRDEGEADKTDAVAPVSSSDSDK